MGELGLQRVHGLVEDDGSVRIVDTTITTDYKLRCFETGVGFVQQTSKFGVGLDEVGDAFGGVEAGNLNEVFLKGPFELGPVRVLELRKWGGRKGWRRTF